MDSDDDETDPVSFTFGDVHISISTAENEFNKDKKTLFATYVWNGSQVLANLLVSQYAGAIKDRSVLELGAGAGLPSILSAKLGASLVCASDYPSKCVQKNLRRNVDRNHVESQVVVQEYMWGDDVQPLLQHNRDGHYDVIVATECLWRHESHNQLLQSILAALKNPGGQLFLTYSHHVPGLEAEDDQFIALAEAAGLTVTRLEEFDAPHMWNEEKRNPITFVHFTR